MNFPLNQFVIPAVLFVTAWDALATLSLVLAILIIWHLERWRYLLVVALLWEAGSPCTC
jgi:hypothetical protein